MRIAAPHGRFFYPVKFHALQIVLLFVPYETTNLNAEFPTTTEQGE